ncbi:MAG TPA: hypothetical protein VD997_07385 [Phycisphaerales bacterium]|nr:hypothetical protein [Phycisphaerales bacterium]
MLLPRRHWTPRYVANRFNWELWQRRNPTLPWLVPGAVEFLHQYLRDSDLMVEFGSGRSTAWFARHCGHVISIEHHAGWHATVLQRLKDAGHTNVDYLLIDEPEDHSGDIRIGALRNNERYVRAAEPVLKGRKLDVVLIDGMIRDQCAHWALDHLKPGGLFILDNANVYLPSKSRTPGSVGAQPLTPLWQQWLDRTAHWRRVWYSSGVTETMLAFAAA